MCFVESPGARLRIIQPSFFLSAHFSLKCSCASAGHCAPKHLRGDSLTIEYQPNSVATRFQYCMRLTSGAERDHSLFRKKWAPRLLPNRLVSIGHLSIHCVFACLFIRDRKRGLTAAKTNMSGRLKAKKTIWRRERQTAGSRKQQHGLTVQESVRARGKKRHIVSRKTTYTVAVSRTAARVQPLKRTALSLTYAGSSLPFCPLSLAWWVGPVFPEGWPEIVQRKTGHRRA